MTTVNACCVVKEAGLYDAYAKFISMLMNIRPGAFLKKGELVRFVDEDAPQADALDTHCPACGRVRQNSKRLLCVACRGRPQTIELGPTLANVMVRGGSEKYRLDHDKKIAIVALREQQELAADALLLARILMQRAFQANQRGEQSVRFRNEVATMGGSYASITACGLAESFVPVGGVGLDLHAQLLSLAEEWLCSIDEKTRRWHGIPIHQDDNQTVLSHIKLYASQIATRVALLEPGDALSTATLEHRAKAAFLHDDQAAEEQCARDVSAMALLTAVARHGVADETRWPNTLGSAARAALTELLAKPPPEILKILPQTAASMRFDVLRAVFEAHVDRKQTSEEVDAWRASVNIETLCLLLQRATRRVEEWVSPSGSFIETVVRSPVGISDSILVGLRYDPTARLPAVPWRNTNVDWTLLNSERLACVRTGLGPAALRVVLITSILRQMMGVVEGETDVFEGGVVRCSILHQSASRASRAAQAAYEQLGEDMRPLMAGFEAAVAKHTLSNFENSHVDDDVRDAARTVCRFSLDDLIHEFSDAASNSRLVKLIGNYTAEPLSTTVIELAMPLLKSLRVDKLGWGFNTSSSFAVELLLEEPAISKSTGGELVLSHGDLRNEQTKKLLTNLVKSGKITQRRIGTKVHWVFDPVLLLALLRH